MPWAMASHSDSSKTQVMIHAERRADICECQHPERITAVAKQLSMAWERVDELFNVKTPQTGELNCLQRRVPEGGGLRGSWWWQRRRT